MFDTSKYFIKFSDRLKVSLYEDLQIWTEFEMKYKEEKFPRETDNIYADKVEIVT